MSPNSELFSLIILICFSFSESNTFCEQTDQSKSLVNSVFNIHEDIYLIRGQDFWVSTAFSKKPDPTPRSLKNKFLGVEIKKLMAGFVVESIPNSCKDSKEKCRFNDWMLSTCFLFYKSYHNSRQVYSMFRWDKNNQLFTFDDKVGGYGYQLRANRSVARSSWPGISNTVNETIATLFDNKNNRIILFANNMNDPKKVTLIKKSLEEEWHVPITAFNFEFEGQLIGAFKWNNKNYYLMNSFGKIFRITDLDSMAFDKTNPQTDRQFFGCP